MQTSTSIRPNVRSVSVDQTLEMLFGGNVRGERQRAAGAEFLVDGGGHLLTGFEVAGRYDDLGALLGHPLDDGAADAAR